MLVIFLILLLAASSCDADTANRRRRHHKKPKLDPDVQTLMNNLWNLDKNRVKFGTDFNLCYQGKVKDGGDEAPNPLICKMNTNVLNGTTFKAMVDLMDNYNRFQGQPENVTKQEVAENNNFLDLVIKSDVMKAVYSFLVKKGKASSDPAKFRSKLYQLWFETYSRIASSGILDSSGFEHVFVGEIVHRGRRQSVRGFHNWIHVYMEEKANHLNYLGYRKKTESPLVLNYRFTWYGFVKPSASSFFGTSPEFEMSLYTALYMMGYRHAIIELDGIKVTIICSSVNGHKNIDTCYPSLW